MVEGVKHNENPGVTLRVQLRVIIWLVYSFGYLVGN
jgi:hypothetical protein